VQVIARDESETEDETLLGFRSPCIKCGPPGSDRLQP